MGSKGEIEGVGCFGGVKVSQERVLARLKISCDRPTPDFLPFHSLLAF